VSILNGGVVTRALVVSIGITIVGTLLSVFFTATLAYGLTRTKDVPGTKAMLYLILVTMFFAAGIIPNYLLVKHLGLIDSYWSLILPTLISAFNMIVLRNFFLQLPRELLDAARIDGAGEWQIFAGIVLPLSKAVLAVIALFYAVGYWNSFFNAILYLNDSTKWPIQLVLNQYVLRGSSLQQIQNPEAPVPPAEAVQMAVVVLATLPILVVYPFVQKYFTKGVLTGAVKG
jgi:ABC-type glycerol-3-phosphate transport system permease component